MFVDDLFDKKTLTEAQGGGSPWHSEPEQDMAEAGYKRDAYQRDHDNSVAGMGKRQSRAYQDDGGGNDERHDLDPTEWYIVKDGKMFKVTVYPNQVQSAMSQGFSPSKEEAQAKAKQQGMAEGSKEKTQGIALSKAYKKDFDDKKPGHNKPETALTGTYSKTGKPGGELKKQGVAEVSDATLTSYLTKLDRDNLKHRMDPTKRSDAKRMKSGPNFVKAFTKLDNRKQGVAEADDPINYNAAITGSYHESQDPLERLKSLALKK